jgi:arylsulfatase/uncharacterized sulfatase
MHIPVQAPREFTDHYRGRFDGGWEELQRARWVRAKEMGLVSADAPLPRMPAGSRKWDGLTPDERAIFARSMEVYSGMMEAMDHHVGRLVTHLKGTGQFENTVFVVTSDNGPEPSDPVHKTGMGLWMLTQGYSWNLEGLGEKGSLAYIGPEWAAAVSSPGSIFKFYSASGGIHVHLVMSGPGIRAGLRSAALTHVSDITPTILDLASVGRAAADDEVPMTGMSLRALLEGSEEGGRTDSEPLGIEVSGNAALFRGPFKIVRNSPPHGDRQWHLYHTFEDPGETHDLGASMPDVLAGMISAYEAYERRMGVLPLPEGYDVHGQIRLNVMSRLFRAHRLHLLVAFLATAVTTWALLRLRTGKPSRRAVEAAGNNGGNGKQQPTSSRRRKD